MNALLRHLRGKDLNSSLPLDIRATAFQRRVWAYLQSIPFGETKSYSEVAKAIGKPRGLSRRGSGVRHESGCCGDPLPPGGSRRWQHGRISLGPGAQESSAADGARRAVRLFARNVSRQVFSCRTSLLANGQPVQKGHSDRGAAGSETCCIRSESAGRRRSARPRSPIRVPPRSWNRAGSGFSSSRPGPRADHAVIKQPRSRR